MVRLASDLAVGEPDGRVLVLLDHNGTLLRLYRRSLGRQHHQYGIRFFFDVFHDLPQVVLDQIVEVLLLLCLSLQFLRHEEDFIVDLLVPIDGGLDIVIKLSNFLGDMFVHGSPNPAHLVLVDLLDVPDALQHVGDIVDAALLHPQLSGCLVDVQHEVVARLDQADEALGQQRKRVLSLALLLALAFSLSLLLLPHRLLLRLLRP